jgi:hypothetical protein
MDALEKPTAQQFQRVKLLIDALHGTRDRITRAY